MLTQDDLQAKPLGNRYESIYTYTSTVVKVLSLLSEQIVLRKKEPESIFLTHYFRENPKLLSDKILGITYKRRRNSVYLD
jgi:hypothetical protein